MNARTLLAGALGALRGNGCRCALCGASPFDAAGSTASVFGQNFVDYWAMEDSGAEHICAGCARCLAGRPGDDPPPLRTRSVIVAEGELSVLDRHGLWAVLIEPPRGSFVLSWSTGGKIHHWLRAGVSTSERLLIGSDRSTIEMRCEDRALLQAVAELVERFPRVAVSGGDYHPKGVTDFGAARWAALERVVQPYRPSALLDLLCFCAPNESGAASETEEHMIEASIRDAATLLANVAAASEFRATRGKEFWGGFFMHRVERFKRLPLGEAVSRLMGECGTSSTAETTHDLLAWLGGIDEGRAAGVERALRTSTALVVALSYETLRARREAAV